MKFVFSDQQRLVFFGDSVPAGHAEPGEGFVAQALARIRARYAGLELEVFRPDPGERTLAELVETLPGRAASLEPDWVILMLGPAALSEIGLEGFDRQYRALVRELKARTRAGLILCEPFVLQPDPADSLRRRIDGYREAAWLVAQGSLAVFVPCQKAFDRVLVGTQAGDWGLPNRLQLNRFGSALLTEEFLGATGFEVFDDDH
ncbi:MAG: GDSL-type esterase/lipase family protein [Meiothermus sp.]|nr:GDSL-type esterase/lipase family protein [Meiothermus sp.]